MDIWLLFFVYAALIVLAGTQLSKNAEKISGGLGLSSAWAGTLLLSTATSLPELVATCRAAMIDAPDLAGGNIFGSNLFNLTLLVLVNLLHLRSLFKARRKRGLIVTALFSIMLSGIAIAAMVMKLPFRAGWVGLDTIFILVAYLSGSAIITELEREKGGEEKHVEKYAECRRGMVKAAGLFLLAAAVIIFAGTGLTDTAELIALETGLGRTLVGSILVAASTSLPELVATIASIRMGLPEMAIGNVFGSSFFNLLLFFITDLFYRKDLLMGVLSPQHIITAIMSIILTTIAVIGLLIPERRIISGLSVSSIIILIGYLATFIYLFYTG